MAQIEETFFTSVGCMDGRVQIPILKFGGQKFGAEFADTITEAGLAGKLSKDPEQNLLESLKTKILISLEMHHSKGIIVHGHEDCAGNPVDEETHKRDILRSIGIIKSLMNSSVPIVGAYVKRSDNDWVVEEVPTTQLV